MSLCFSGLLASYSNVSHNLTLVQSLRGLLVTLACSFLMSLSRALVSLEILFPIRLRLFNESRRRRLLICFFTALSFIVILAGYQRLCPL